MTVYRCKCGNTYDDTDTTPTPTRVLCIRHGQTPIEMKKVEDGLDRN